MQKSTFFAAINHLSRPLVSIFLGLLSVTIAVIESSEKRSCTLGLEL